MHNETLNSGVSYKQCVHGILYNEQSKTPKPQGCFYVNEVASAHKRNAGRQASHVRHLLCVCVWGEGVLVFNYASEPTSCAARLSRRFYSFLLSLLLFYVRVLREIK